MKILLVEDQELHRKVLGARLKRAGHTIIEASDGTEALNILRKSKVSAVVSDVLMPKMDGYELCQNIRSSAQLSSLPLILYSAIYTSPEDEKTALVAGADLFFRKPVVEADLLSGLEGLVSRARRGKPKAKGKPKKNHPLEEYSVRLVEKLEEKNVELEESQTRFQTLVKTVASAIFIYQPGKIIYANPAAEDLTGYEVAQIVKMSPLDIIVPEDRELATRRLFMGHGIVETSSRIDIRVVSSGGRVKWVDFSASVIEYNGAQSVIGTALDITKRKQAEQNLKNSEERFREQAALLDVDPAAISVVDLEGRILFWNRSAERLYGWPREDVMGKRIAERLAGQLKATYEEAGAVALEKGKWQGEWVHHPGEKAECVIESDWTLVRDSKGKPKFVYVVDSDITEKKRLEKQFLRAQRMESLGMIAGGIAHELNNVLGPIFLSLEMIKREVTDERIKKLLQMIETSSKRGSEIVKQILGFVGGMEEKRAVVSLTLLLKEIEHLTRQTFSKAVQIRTRVAKDVWPILGNATQLHQVLLNLCINARDAMPNGGTLTLEGENQVLDEHYARFHPHVLAGAYVMLTVTDTGMGIPVDVLGRIFEPFFTTKGKEKGTGLGLSVVAGIVQNHGGFVNVYSEAGKGTSFRIYLPAVRTDETEQAVERKKDLPRGRGETVLVVEDEPLVLEIVKETLESYGYRVLGANDGTEAIGLYTQNKEQIALVLCDMAMPFMDGPSTIRALQKMKGGVKVVVVSGFADAGKVLMEFGDTVRAFLPKPYPADKLLQTIHDVLSA